MTSDVNHITLNNWIWIQFKDHLITFGLQKISKEIHFTFAFNSNSNDINFHITKNSGTDNEKPKIEIAIIDKKLAEEVKINTILSILGTILQPFDIDAFKIENPRAKYLSMDFDESSEFYRKTESKIIEQLENNSKKNGRKRLEIKGDIEEAIKSITTSDDLIDILNSRLEEIPTNYDKRTDTGQLICDNTNITVLRIDNFWYTIKEDLGFFDILKAIVDKDTAQRLNRYLKKSIIRVKNATTRAETTPFNRPERLVKSLPPTKAITNGG